LFWFEMALWKKLSVSKRRKGGGKGNEHLLLDVGLLLLSLKVSVDVGAFLTDDLSLCAGERVGQRDWYTIAEERKRRQNGLLSSVQTTSSPMQGARRTFSIANSSSALTLISRAFSRASCLMKAVCEG
jgi:hypothetical protein